MAVEDVPVFVVDEAGLVADPACVAVVEEGCVGEDDGVGLVGAEGFEDAGEVVDVAGGASAVEPEFDEVAVAGGEFFEFAVVVGVVCGGVQVAGVVAIPWGEVDAEFEAVFAGGAGDIADDVSVAVAPGAGFDGVGGLVGGPEAEAVVVLGDEDDVASAGGGNGGHPLVGVEVGGVEGVG